MEKSEWSDRIKTQYLSGASNQFVVHGNVHDRMIVSGGRPSTEEGAHPAFGNLMDYLVAYFLEM